MTSRTLVLVLATLAFAGCDKKKGQQGAGTASGTGPASGTAVAPPLPRASQQPQPTLPLLELPEDAKRKEKIALGHVLFFDKRLSGNNDRACYSCHMNEDGNGGHDPIAIGSGDKK